MTAPTSIDRGYCAHTWAKDADRDAYRAAARKEYPHASDAQIEDLARVGSMMDRGTRHFIAVPHPGLGVAVVHVDDLPVADPSHLRRAA